MLGSQNTQSVYASMNSMNPLVGVFPITTAGSILLASLAMAAVVLDRMWRRLPGDHPAVHQEIVTSASATSSGQQLVAADPASAQ
jgi:hypothetical protein